MPAPRDDRVRKRRQTLRTGGLLPLQISVPDTREPGFPKECRRQARLMAEADLVDQDLQVVLEAAWGDLVKIAE